MADSDQSAGSKPSALKVIGGFVGFLAAIVTLLAYLGYEPGNETDTPEGRQATAAASVTGSPPPPPSAVQPESPAAIATTQATATGAEALYVSATLAAPNALGKDRGIACPDWIPTYCLA